MNRIGGSKQLAAGVVDAGLASLATFASGLTGVNLLSDVDRGVYAVFFTAFILGTVLIGQLIYVPSQVVAVGHDLGYRLGGLRRTIRLAALPSLCAATTALLAAFLQRDITSTRVLVALTATTAATILVSGMQDYVRRSLHIAERSWQAAAVSGVQLLGVATAIPLMIASDIERAWIPYGSLFFANVVSVSFGLFIAGAHRRPRHPLALRFKSLAASGKWLVLRAAAPSAGAFIAANILTKLAGPIATGHAEAARQVAQPVTVLALGLGAVLGPRAVRAGIDVDPHAAVHTRREHALIMILASVAYIAVAGPAWSLNPMSRLVPSAYEVSFLVAVTVVGNTLAALVTLPMSELLGAGRAKLLAGLAFISSPALLLAALTAGTTGAFARPIGFIAEGALALGAARWWLARHYQQLGPPEQLILEARGLDPLP